MAKNKRNKIEYEFQKEIIAKGKELGWWIYSIPDSRRATAKGYIDLTIMHFEKELLMGAELKTPKGRLTPEQKTCMTLLSKYYPVHLWRPKHMDTIQYMLKHGIIFGNTQYPTSQRGEMVYAPALEAGPL